MRLALPKDMEMNLRQDALRCEIRREDEQRVTLVSHRLTASLKSLNFINHNANTISTDSTSTKSNA